MMNKEEPVNQEFEKPAYGQGLAAAAILVYGLWLAFQALIRWIAAISMAADRYVHFMHRNALFNYSVHTALLTGGAILLILKYDAIAKRILRRYPEAPEESRGAAMLEALMPLLGIIMLVSTFSTIARFAAYLHMWWVANAGNLFDDQLEYLWNWLDSNPLGLEITMTVLSIAAKITIGLVLIRSGSRLTRRIYRLNGSAGQADVGRTIQ